MNAAAVIVPIVPAIKLKRVLYATDFSEGSKMAWPVVSALARHYGSEVLVAHFFTPLPYPMATPEAVAVLDQKREHEAQEKVASLLQGTEALGISIVPIVKSGEAVSDLEKTILEKAPDLVVLSTHGRVGVKRLLMGSVAEAVFRNVTCPVLTVGPHLDERFKAEVNIKNILFPTDLSEESRSVFPYLCSLAHEYKAKVTLLHVLPPETESNPDAKALAEPLRKEMQRIFGHHISPECEAEFVIEAGDVAERILKEARDRNADLIGFGIRKAPEIITHLRDTVTYQVLIHASCPVLTCRQHPQW